MRKVITVKPVCEFCNQPAPFSRKVKPNRIVPMCRTHFFTYGKAKVIRKGNK